jgi:hypothetical protein
MKALEDFRNFAFFESEVALIKMGRGAGLKVGIRGVWSQRACHLLRGEA